MNRSLLRPIFSLILAGSLLSACKAKVPTEPEMRATCQGLAYEYGVNKYLVRGYQNLSFGAHENQFISELKAILGDSPNANARALAYAHGQELAQKYVPGFVDHCTGVYKKLPTTECQGKPAPDQYDDSMRRGMQTYIEAGILNGQLKLNELNEEEVISAMKKAKIAVCK